MATVEETYSKYRGFLNEIGKRALSALYPNDFEFYMISFELVDSTGLTHEYFTFPIMASSIDKFHQELTNIRKTAGGISVTDNNTLIPIQTTIKGNFGKRFKFLLGNDIVNFVGLVFSTQEGFFSRANLSKAVTTIKGGLFSSQIKTGYGCTKILEAILLKSKGLDPYGKPFNLFMYNTSFGDNYLVKVNSHSYNTDKERNNMIWEYTINLTLLARLEELSSLNPTSLVLKFGTDYVNRKVTNLTSQLRREIFQ